MSAFTYPGVYIEEIPSGVHPITGVATSITAFVGWANQGPVNQAVLVQSWTDFQNRFGGLNSQSYLGYAVNQFFGNGGQQAYIVRIVWDGSLAPAQGSSPTPCATAFAAGIGIAEAAIQATLNGVTGNALLTVGSPVLESISISPSTPPWIPVGQSLQFTATGVYSDGVSRTLPNAINTLTWSPGPGGVAVISSGGIAKGVVGGTAVITAASGAVTASVELVVSATATLSTIQVSPASPSIAAGLSQQFTATGTYSDGSSQDLTAIVAWAGTGTVTLVGPGLFTSKTPQSSNITADWGGAPTGKATLTIDKATVVSIAITPSNPTVESTAGTQAFTATATMSDGTTAAAPSPAWSSSNVAVAKIDPSSGLATLASPAAAGTTSISVTSEGVTAYTALAVTAAMLKSITITPANPTAPTGENVQFKATGNYSDGTTADLTGSANWTNATAGLAKAVAGATTIQASWESVNGSTTLTGAAAALVSIAISPSNVAIASGATQQFKAQATYSDGSTSDVTGSVSWSASPPAVASINTSGLAQALSGGATLTLFANSPGQWGNNLQIGIVSAGSSGRFTLQVWQVVNGISRMVESFPNLSTNPLDPLGQYVVTVIDNDSNYVTFVDPLTGAVVAPSGPPASTPVNSPMPLGGGADGTALMPATDGNFESALDVAGSTSGGVTLLSRVDIFNLLCVPGETDQGTIQELQKYCADHRAFYIVDCPQNLQIASLITSGPIGTSLPGSPPPVPGALSGQNSPNSAYYFPWVSAPDSLAGNRSRLFPPCGFVAGNYAATDSNRGVWKAPAGIDASLSGVSGLQYVLTDLENGSLNIQAVDCLRQFKVYGDVIWGARTLQGNDQAGSQWKYIPIRRMALFLESSLYDGLQWVVFEPNDEKLWGQIRLNVGAFMQLYFLKGAFQGTSPQQAYFVKCDSENNPQSSIDMGIVNILVAFAPLYPAEFVVIQIQQLAGQVQA
jgi:phage tail sheath protein FI